MLHGSSQLPLLVHLGADVQSADQLALDVHLRVGRPVGELLEALADLLVLHDVVVRVAVREPELVLKELDELLGEAAAGVRGRAGDADDDVVALGEVLEVLVERLEGRLGLRAEERVEVEVDVGDAAALDGRNDAALLPVRVERVGLAEEDHRRHVLDLELFDVGGHRLVLGVDVDLGAGHGALVERGVDGGGRGAPRRAKVDDKAVLLLDELLELGGVGHGLDHFFINFD